MRQVPKTSPGDARYLIVGDGRVARHFRHYFSLLNIPFSKWSRVEPSARLQELAAGATHILVLISDAAIESFIAGHLQNTSAIKVHFSGSLVTPKAFGAHALMTFGPTLYTLEKYKSIPFVVDDNAPEDILTGLPNAQHRLPQEQKEKYHAMCVMAGNYTCLLWQKFFDTMKQEFKMPPEMGHPFLRQQMENLLNDHASALTGPLARGDHETVQKNISALRGDAFQSVYKAFVEAYRQEKKS